MKQHKIKNGQFLLQEKHNKKNCTKKGEVLNNVEQKFAKKYFFLESLNSILKSNKKVLNV